MTIIPVDSDEISFIECDCGLKQFTVYYKDDDSVCFEYPLAIFHQFLDTLAKQCTKHKLESDFDNCIKHARSAPLESFCHLAVYVLAEVDDPFVAQHIDDWHSRLLEALGLG